MDITTPCQTVLCLLKTKLPNYAGPNYMRSNQRVLTRGGKARSKNGLQLLLIGTCSLLTWSRSAGDTLSILKTMEFSGVMPEA